MIVSAAVIIEHGRVLLTKRKASGHLPGCWEFPGGKVEPGEDPKDALCRELREELGIETSIGDVVEVTFHRYNDVGKAVLLLFYVAVRIPSSIEPRALDVADFKWAEAAELRPEEFPPADVAILEKVQKRISRY